MALVESSYRVPSHLQLLLVYYYIAQIVLVASSEYRSNNADQRTLANNMRAEY